MTGKWGASRAVQDERTFARVALEDMKLSFVPISSESSATPELDQSRIGDVGFEQGVQKI
jgi:hypothetical protein